jgi:hypothetical protein
MTRFFRMIMAVGAVLLLAGADVDFSAIDALQPSRAGTVGPAGVFNGYGTMQPSTATASTLFFDANFSMNGPRVSGGTLPLASFASSMSLAFYCLLDDVSGSSLACQTSTGTTTFTSAVAPALRPSPFLDDSRGVQFVRASDTDNLNAASAVVGDVSTGSFVLSATILAEPNAEAIVGKKGGFTTEAGWGLRCTTSVCVPRIYLGDGTTGIQADCPNNTSGSARLVGIAVFFKPNDATGLQCFANGSGGTAVSTVGLGSISSADIVSIGAMNAAGLSDSEARVFSVKMWTGPAAALVTSEYAAIATRMESMVFGTLADTAKGSPDPTTSTRSSITFVDKAHPTFGTRRLFGVSTQAMRLARRLEAVGGEVVSGFLVEAQSTNLLLRSQEFDNVAWTKVDAGDVVTANATTALDDLATADALVGDATDGGHGWTQAPTLTATTYTLSVWALAGSKTFLYLSDDTVANATGYVNLATCVAGTAGAGATVFADPWPYDSDFDGDQDLLWCRASITFTGTAAAHTLRIEAADADGDHSTVGNGVATMITTWQAQVEAQRLPTSAIQTTSATATRNADDLRYNAVLNALPTQGSVVVSGLRPAHSALNDTEYFASIGNPAGSQNKVYMLTGNDGCRLVVSDNTGADTAIITGTTDVSDGERHTCRGIFSATDTRIFLDGTGEGTPDTSSTMPVSFVSIFIGEARSIVGQPNGLIERVRVFGAPIPGSPGAP